MIGKMERTANKLFETYIGGMEIDNGLCIQVASRAQDGGFVESRLLLSREAVQTLIPILKEFIGDNAALIGCNGYFPKD